MSTIQTRTKILICVLVILGAYAFGRWSAPDHIKEVIKTVEVEKKHEVDSSKTDKKDRTKTTIIVTTKPDGTKQSVTTISNDVDTTKTTASNETTVDSKSSESSKEITRASSKVSIELIGAVDITKPLGIDYGINLSKPVLGPITFDTFIYKSLRVGFGIGLTF